MPSRRSFLTGLIAAGSVPRLGWADAGAPAFLAAGRSTDGHYVLCGLRVTGDIAFRLPLPDRGHAAAAHTKAPEAVAFARRPGTFALILDCARGDVVARLAAPTGRHFYGHGAFDSAGDLLLTTENDIDTGVGRIGLWSRAKGYMRVGDIESGGIGPHEVIRLKDGGFAIANGGIRTHPDTGRAKLNLDTMRPNLTILNADLSPRDQVQLPPSLSQHSLRHLAEGPNGLIACAFQWQGDIADSPSVLGLYRPNGGLILAPIEPTDAVAMQGYAGSVAVARTRIAVTGPRGALALVTDLGGNTRHRLRKSEICGAAAHDEGLILTDGWGGLHGVDQGKITRIAQHELDWDNHLVAL